MQRLIFLLLLALPLSLLGQRNLYFNKANEPVDSAQAYYRHELTEMPNGWEYVKKYQNIDTLYQEGAYSIYKIETSDTSLITSLKSKKASRRGDIFLYKESIEEGTHKNYRSDGSLWYTEEYVSGKLQGELRSYYPGGQLKRIERYEAGKFISGECFQEDGSPRPFTHLQQAPQYPGGEQALFKHISDNLNYPKKARQKNIQGKVVVTFVVNKDGSVSDVSVVKGIGGGCDEEAVRLMTGMAQWQPGAVDDDHPVKVRYTLPLTFRLQ